MATDLQKRDKTLKDKMLRLGFGSTPQKARIRIAQICKEMDYDPILYMVEAAKQGFIPMRLPDGTEISVALDAKDIIGIHKEIAGYMAPKLRSVDVQADVKANIKISVQKFAGNIIEGVVTEMEDDDMIREQNEEQSEMDLSAMSKQQLVDLAENLGLPKHGTKENLIMRIEEVMGETPTISATDTEEETDGDEENEEE